MTEGPHKEVRETLNRAIRRLDMLEYAILIVIAGLSLAGGALIALLAGSVVSVPFRAVWAVSSILLFTIPAVIVRRRERAASRKPENDPPTPSARDANG